MTRHRIGRGVLVVGVSALFLVVPARSASAVESIVYVDGANSKCADTGSGGTISKPFCSIKKAAQVAQAGQTVLVSSGTYGGGAVVAKSGTPSEPIVFEPAPGATVVVTGGTNGFKVSGRSWITIRGFTVRSTVGAGLYLKGASNLRLEDNDVSIAGLRTSGNTAPGIRVDSTTASVLVGNVSHDNSDHGIHLLNGSTGNHIVSNVSYANARAFSRVAEGIFLHASPANTVEGNLTHHNEDSGIGLWNGSNNSVVLNNVVHDNGDHGIDILGSTGERIVANTVFGNVDSGIELQSNAGADLANNISVDNGINSPRTKGNIRVVDSGSAAQTTMDYDVLFLSSDNVLIDYLGAKYSSLSAFQAARGKELNGKQADPKFTNSGAGDFHLLPVSPAIDSANSGATSQPATDFDGNVRVDDPLTANTGAGPRNFDDRGAFEFEPSGDLPPTANNDSLATLEDTPATVAVLANDSDPDDDPLTVTGASVPAHGNAVVNPDNTITYSPATNYFGTDAFTYAISDGRGGTASATVSITVGPVDDVPVANDDSVTTPRNVAKTITVLANDTDVDGDSLTVTDASTPGHGSAVVNPDNTVTYVPETDYTGPDSFTYTIDDGNGGSASATVAVEVEEPDTAHPPTANPQSVSLNQDTTTTVTLTGSDPDGDALRFKITALPANGKLYDGAGTGGHRIAAGELPYALTGTFDKATYQPNTGYSGSDSFAFKANDGQLDSASAATVSITVNASANLIANPGFETDLSGWQAGAAFNSLTRVAGGHSGGWAAQLSNSSAGAQCTLDDKPNSVAVTQAGPYTARIWVRSDTPGLSFKLRLREFNGGNSVGSASTTVTLTASWQLVTVVYTPTAPGISNIDFQAYTTNSPVGVCFRADDASLTH